MNVKHLTKIANQNHLASLSLLTNNQGHVTTVAVLNILLSYQKDAKNAQHLQKYAQNVAPWAILAPNVGAGPATKIRIINLKHR